MRWLRLLTRLRRSELSSTVRRWAWNLVSASGPTTDADVDLSGISGVALLRPAPPKLNVSAWQTLADERRREAVVWATLGLAAFGLLLLSFVWPGWLLAGFLRFSALRLKTVSGNESHFARAGAGRLARR